MMERWGAMDILLFKMERWGGSENTSEDEIGFD